MLNELLPYNLSVIVSKLDYKKLCEIRCRLNMPIIVKYNGQLFFLNNLGLTNERNDAIFCDKFIIDFIVSKASNNSIYSVNNEIVQGFITCKGGIRIGLTGEIVTDKSIVKTIKNFQGINIRIPHQIEDCSKKIIQFLYNENKEVYNTLIISPPGAGKTTMLRDIIRQFSNNNIAYNYLIIDERNEITNCINGISTLNVGDFCDIISNCNKSFAFEYAIRSMSPDIILTDELSTKEDFFSIVKSATCGIKIITTIHANDLDDLKKKRNFELLLTNKIFDRFVILSNRLGPGTIEGVFDKKEKRLL